MAIRAPARNDAAVLHSAPACDPSFRRLQLAAAGGATRRDLPAAPSAPPPHDDSGHGKYQREHAGQKHDELPDRPAVAALVDPAYPLRRTVAGERVGQTRDRAAAVVDGHGRDLVALGIAQLHAPPRARPRSLLFALAVGRNMTAGRVPGCDASARDSASSGASRASRTTAPKA